ncbi:polysaccharide biosynthesis protein [Desulforhopalus sp. 52FAK]
MLTALRTTIFLHLSFARQISRNPKFWVVISVDILLLIISLYCAYTLRFEGNVFQLEESHQFLAILPITIAVKIPVFYFWGLYRGMWRYTSTEDLFNILKATSIATLVLVVVFLYVNRFAGLSRSVFILDTIFTFILICAHRVSLRLLYSSSNGSSHLISAGNTPPKKRLLLIGAGDAAEKILRELKTNQNLPYIPVALLDDDPRKAGLKIHGVPVVGKVDDLKEHALVNRIDEVLISIASAKGRKIKRFVELCQEIPVAFKVIPGFGELIDGNISVKTIRDISYNDLLGREEVELEQGRIGEYLSGKTILVTGAGGSIGSELCRQILRFSPGKILLFDSSEENLYNIEMELLHECGFNDTVTFLGKVQDISLLNMLFEQYRPAVVFHAAAYKHVPLVERNPWQAIENNVFGTQLLIEASIIYKIRRFVLVSTDKAVRPTNVMGASKRLTELLVQAYNANTWDKTLSPAWERVLSKDYYEEIVDEDKPFHDTMFMAVRFGNVIGSSGSVIPLFKKQIERGGPVTVTHPEMTRYFMSIDEAAQLILQAGSMGKGREIFILKMGQPIKIDLMARELIRLAGKEPDSEIEIVYTGLREGEKLYEELITAGEDIVDTEHKKIMVLRGDSLCPCSILHKHFVQLAAFCSEHDAPAIKTKLHSIVPEYLPALEVQSVVKCPRSNAVELKN